jgi:hypothetical protein
MILDPAVFCFDVDHVELTPGVVLPRFLRSLHTALTVVRWVMAHSFAPSPRRASQALKRTPAFGEAKNPVAKEGSINPDCAERY